MPADIPGAAGGTVAVIAVGKAGATMMAAAQARAPRPLPGLVVVPHGHLPAARPGWPGVDIIEAGHPYPDAGSLAAADRALAVARGLRARDTLLVLLSGGGSALLAAPVAGVTLADKQAVTRQLLHCGATIAEINTVRKRLSRIKGGGLTLAAAPARVVTWIISDVPGDDPALVASGPTIADCGALADARAVIARYGIAPPASVAAALADPADDRPSSALVAGEVRVIAAARDALAAAQAAATARGWRVQMLGDNLQGEARRLGADHAALARALAPAAMPQLILSGGETTVTVGLGAGRGGRNLEYLLGLALALDGAAGIAAVACDTDGIDGTSDAAGATIGPDTLARARRLGLDPAACLAANDAYRVFAALGDLIVTGPTLTNVNDFRAILIEPHGAAPASVVTA